LNPRPKTVGNGFYILIPKFEFYLKISFGMDILKCSLKKFSLKRARHSFSAILLSRRPVLKLQASFQ